MRDGGPAFPRSGAERKLPDPQQGMTLLDYFAGCVLQGAMANSAIEINGDGILRLVDYCYKVARAMVDRKEYLEKDQSETREAS